MTRDEDKAQHVVADVIVECGIKVAGYDDIKVDDVIEAYRIEQVMRTLS